MANRIRNRVIGQKVDEAKEHFEENRSAYVAGAVGFLFGGFIVLAFSRRPQVRVIVENKTVYLNSDRKDV